MTNQHQILLVDDSAADAMLIREALQEGKVQNELHYVKNGDEALEFLRSENDANPEHIKPGLILLDLYMPKKSGLQVLEVIKNDTDLKAIPVIVMTSSNEEEDISKAYKAGANSYIVKPVNFNKLVEVIETVEEFWLNIVELPS